ncbi:hypothetical protein B0I35DRAFT_179184 [Stachybotrys elegans]|uniref:Nephrocystin 3-like N-terminal domain-containing protein n=1 Tax=Stachybotrys elegans TaxID=80388 RepID=A0A8K0SD30_9HYPO|nr:hypothetical protein B0I35DRAFT_179184 [Stachybotrys elegans]
MAQAQRDEDDGVPAALHEGYKPSDEQRMASDVHYHGDAAVDVIFVHGLGSKSSSTWTYKRKDGSRYNWLEEQFPKDMPDARVLIYEYESRWYDDPVHVDLKECAAQLLRTLINDRRHAHSQALCPTRRTRPMILIGHSFGGLVIKQAIAMAGSVRENMPHCQYENHRDILAAIAGVIFLGTPHRGTSFSWLASLKSFFGKSILQVQSSDEIIRILTPASPILLWVQSEFEETCKDERLANLQLICYYEMRDTMPLRRRVVEQESATLDNAASRGMNSNHVDMNTFYAGDNGQKDNNYDHFVSDIQMVFGEAQTSVHERFNRWIYGSAGPDPVRERLQRALNASREVQDTTYLRYLETFSSAPYTCQWIHDLPLFRDWAARSDERRMLWLNGHGGSGKSVLTSYIINSLRGSSSLETRNSWTPCSNTLANSECGARRNSPTVLFFFYGVDRSSEVTERVLGTLIHQLLLAWPENGELVKIANGLLKTTLSPRNLTETLAKMISLVGPTYLILDNLEDMMYLRDENPSTIIKWLSQLRFLVDVQILISSQETPIVSYSLSENFHIRNTITITDYSSQDIENFTIAQSEALFEKKPSLVGKRETIVDALRSRAQGSFQWLNSAFEHLKHVEDVEDVEPELDDIGGDLLDSYDKTFERLGFNRTPRIKKRMLLCLKFMAASATPVTCADIKVAWLVQELLDNEKQNRDDFVALFKEETCQSRVASADADIRNYLSPIIDVCSDGTLQFKHMSYLKALTRTDTASSTAGAAEFKFSLENAHRDLSVICMTVCRVTTFVHTNSFVEWRIPLIQYSWNFWAYHLEKSRFHFATVEEAATKKRELKMSSEQDHRWQRRNAMQEAFNSMLSDITYDALLYLEALMDFISRPLRAVPGHFSDREYVLSLQRAQESLCAPSKDLCTLKRSQYDSPSSRLEHARQKAELATHFAGTGKSLDAFKNEAEDRASEAKVKLMGKSSSVRNLRVDQFFKSNSAVARASGTQKLLLETARNLRSIALRFSVDPIYSALLATAGGKSFSPLHPLVYLAQLFEESGTYPYWRNLPPGRDLMEPFLCPTDDPEYASAKFVLHCFEWRDPRISETIASPTKTSGFYVRTGHFTLDLRPSHWKKGLTRVSTENFEQVKRLHKVKPETYLAAHSNYRLFESGDDFFQNIFYKPLAKIHLRYSLLLHEYNNPKEDPITELTRHTPDEIRQAPLTELIKALPTLLKSYFVHYLSFILQVCGTLARQAMGVHITKIEAAIQDLKQVAFFFWRIYEPGELPPAKPAHIAIGLAMFVLRCLYFPTWGAYIWYHSWSQFTWSWNHPAAYIDIQRDYGFWSICYQILLYSINAGVGATTIAMTLQPDVMKTPLYGASFSYSIFHSLCAIDRSLFAICSAFATLLACGKIMFFDVESIASVLRFSMFFWFMVFFDLTMAAMNFAAQQHGGGWKTVMGTVAVHMTLLVLMCRNIGLIMDVLYGLTKPGRIVAVWIFKFGLRASVVTAQMLGIGLLMFSAIKAFFIVHKFIWDPYDVGQSLKSLMQASENIHNTLVVGGVTQYRRVGWYPLGEKQMLEDSHVASSNAQRGPPRAHVPLLIHADEAKELWNEAAGEVVGKFGGYLEGGQLQEQMDRMVMATGDQVGQAIDGVGQHIGRVMDGVGKGLSQEAAKLALTARDLVDGGHQKKE